MTARDGAPIPATACHAGDRVWAIHPDTLRWVQGTLAGEPRVVTEWHLYTARFDLRLEDGSQIEVQQVFAVRTPC